MSTSSAGWIKEHDGPCFVHVRSRVWFKYTPKFSIT